MTKERLLKQESVNMVRIAMVRTELLLGQCNSWLSEEEGRKNMEKQILERDKRLFCTKKMG